MTHAVCIGCGGMKFGALLPCKSCGFRPVSPKDYAYTMAFTDHFLSRDQLEEISQYITETRELPPLAPETEATFLKHYGGYARDADDRPDPGQD